MTNGSAPTLSDPASSLTASARNRVVALTTIFALVLLACWSGALETIAKHEAEEARNRVLVAFALSRTLNGVISVAQGTEIALQPAGVGVTLTAGELLDPLNDLVERFSVLALVASISLEGQILLADLLSTAWVNTLLTCCIGIYLATALIPKLRRFERMAARITSLVVFTRLVFVVVMFSANWLGNLTLAERQDTAVTELTQTREEIASINTAAAAQVTDAGAESSTADTASSASIFDRVTGFFAEQRDALDVGARIAAVVERAEQAVSHLVSLSVLFLLQYVALPIGAFWLAFAGVRTAWDIWWRSQ